MDAVRAGYCSPDTVGPPEGQLSVDFMTGGRLECRSEWAGAGSNDSWDTLLTPLCAS